MYMYFGVTIFYFFVCTCYQRKNQNFGIQVAQKNKLNIGDTDENDLADFQKVNFVLKLLVKFGILIKV